MGLHRFQQSTGFACDDLSPLVLVGVRGLLLQPSTCQPLQKFNCGYIIQQAASQQWYFSGSCQERTCNQTTLVCVVGTCPIVVQLPRMTRNYKEYIKEVACTSGMALFCNLLRSPSEGGHFCDSLLQHGHTVPKALHPATLPLLHRADPSTARTPRGSQLPPQPLRPTGGKRMACPA